MIHPADFVRGRVLRLVPRPDAPDGPLETRVGIHPPAKNPPTGPLHKRRLGCDPQPLTAPHLVWEADTTRADSSTHVEDRLARLAGALGPLRRVLAAIAERLIGTKAHQRLCYARVNDYARERVGVSARQLQELARVHRALAGLPALERALVASELPWSKVRLIARVATKEDEGAWIARARELPTRKLELEVRRSYREGEPQDADDPALEKRVALHCTPAVREKWILAREMAERVTVRRLEQDVERALLLRAGHSRAWARCLFHPERAQDPIPSEERQMCAPDVDVEATQQLAWRVPREVAALFTGVRETLRSRLGAGSGRLASDGEVFEAMLECALLAWTLRDPRARRPDPVVERDGYRCAVPGCTSRRNLHDHHLRFRSVGGSDEPDNRVTLCAFHHQRCLHVGFLRIRGCAPDGLLFELGLRPGGTPLVSYRSGDIEAPTRGTSPLACPQRAA